MLDFNETPTPVPCDLNGEREAIRTRCPCRNCAGLVPSLRQDFRALLWFWLEGDLGVDLVQLQLAIDRIEDDRLGWLVVGCI